jgi:hypothetical protein
LYPFQPVKAGTVVGYFQTAAFGVNNQSGGIPDVDTAAFILDHSEGNDGLAVLLVLV